MTSVPFLDLKTQYAGIRAEILAAVERLLDSGQYVLGDEVAAFEREFASAVGAAHGVGMNSGTSAIQLALLAAGVGPGDEVITVPHTFVATVAAIEYVGARPVLVDIDPASFTMNPALIEQVKEHTPAIRNGLVMLFTGQDPAVLNTREGKEALLKQCLDEVNRVLKEQTGAEGVENVYFTSFVMQ